MKFSIWFQSSKQGNTSKTIDILFPQLTLQWKRLYKLVVKKLYIITSFSSSTSSGGGSILLLKGINVLIHLSTKRESYCKSSYHNLKIFWGLLQIFLVHQRRAQLGSYAHWLVYAVLILFCNSKDIYMWEKAHFQLSADRSCSHVRVFSFHFSYIFFFHKKSAASLPELKAAELNSVPGKNDWL